MRERGLVLLSGGLDSSVLLKYLQQQQYELFAVFFDRNQGALEFERQAAEFVSSEAQIKLHNVSIKDWRQSVYELNEKNRGSIMLNIPRNAIFVLLVTPFAFAYDCAKIFIGSTMDDQATSDSNKEFITSINNLLETTGQGFQLDAPFIDLKYNKTDVVKWAKENIGRDFIDKTRSCYKKDFEPCGVCSACLKRKKAIDEVFSEN